MMSESGEKPAWLERLMAETFFGGCGVHQNRRKNEKNVFCLHCCLSICPHCVPSHPSHPLLQAYTINGAKVIFIKQRPQSRPCKGSANACCTCDRILQDPFLFCSLSCKVDHMVEEGEDLSGILHQFCDSDFAFSHFDATSSDQDSQIAPPSSYGSSGNSVISPLRLPRLVLSLGGRRKGAPQRAPLS